MSGSYKENVAWAWHRETNHHQGVGMETLEKASSVIDDAALFDILRSFCCIFLL